MSLPTADITVIYPYDVIAYNMQTLGLYLARAAYTPPEAKTEYVNVPGRDGDLDYTEVLNNGFVRYGNGELKMTFKAPFINTFENPFTVADFHGKRAEVTFTGGLFAARKFKGRLAVEPIETAKYSGMITITMNVAEISVYSQPAAQGGGS